MIDEPTSTKAQKSESGDAAKISSSNCSEDSFLEQFYYLFQLGRRRRETVSGVYRMSQENAQDSLILETDAGKEAIKVALIQVVKTKECVERRLIYSASKSLKSADTRYSTITRELLVVSFAHKKFRKFLMGNH